MAGDLIRHRVAPFSYGVVYLVTNTVNDRQYIGQTVAYNPIYRWREHLTDSRHGLDFPLYRAIRKYGEESFTFEVIWFADSKAALDISESSFIQLFETLVPGGYNLQVGGSNGRPSSETILKIKASWTLEKRLAQRNTQYKLREDPIIQQRYSESMQRGFLSLESREKARKSKMSLEYQMHRSEVSRRTNAIWKERVSLVMQQKRWITDGVKNCRIDSDQVLPEGWVYGMIRYQGSPLKGKILQRRVGRSA